MHARLQNLWDRLRTNFWFVPTLMVLLATALAGVAVALDQRLQDEVIAGVAWVYTGGPEGARALLSTVAGSVMTVAGTTFSITIAALTLASTQLGPRLLRNFVRDRGNQVVLGTFIATFMYCLLVLRTIRSASEQGLGSEPFTPHLAVTVGVALATASLGVLIYFIHHVAISIQVNHVIAAVGDELHDAIQRLFPESLGRARHAPVVSPVDPLLYDQVVRDGAPLPARQSGYLQAIDAHGLIQLARQQDVVICVTHRPGDFIIEGVTIAAVSPPDRLDEAASQQLSEAFILGSVRTEQQDVTFVIHQLVEIAVRALSPGTNDPFTAIACIERLGAGLCCLMARDVPSAYRYDDDGQLRVIVEPVAFETYVDAAFNAIRQYGRSSVGVIVRLLSILRDCIGCSRSDEQRAALLCHAEMVWRAGQEAQSEPRDREVITEHYHALLAAAQTPLRPPVAIPQK